MKTVISQIDQTNTLIDISKIGNASDCVFIDIETTGLSSDYAFIYMVGLAYYNQSASSYEIKQWLIQNPSEEKEMLTDVITFIEKYNTLVHFNGNTFDLPFIVSRCKANGLDVSFDNFNGIDIFRRVSSLKHFLKLDNCKQKSIELFLGINRNDLYSGKELIKVYRDYSSSLDEEAEKLLLLHNHDDMLGMLTILPILNYSDLFQGDLTVKKVQTNIYNDVFGMQKKELIISFGLPSDLPKAINYNANGCYFSAKDRDGIIKVPLHHEEMKYYYSNYSDYYYLPEEDAAVHKSVAEFVDKDFRVQATAHTCYTRKVSDYLPQFKPLEFEPVFKRDYDSDCFFFELTDALKTNRNAFKAYTDHILRMMYSYK